MTGAPFAGPPLASWGAKTLSCRQSSEVGPLAPPELGVPLAFIGCGQEGPASAAGRGGAQRRSPTGAAAKGMMRKTLADPSTTPTRGPLSIFAVGAGWACAAPAV